MYLARKDFVFIAMEHFNTSRLSLYPKLYAASLKVIALEDGIVIIKGNAEWRD